MDTEQDIISEYNLAAVNSSFESTNLITTSSECHLDVFPTTSDVPLNRPPVFTDQQDDISLCTVQSDLVCEPGADEI